jgi:hypothetical protein
VILFHNRPSGVAESSQADELTTRRLKEALASSTNIYARANLEAERRALERLSNGVQPTASLEAASKLT